jgi:monoamine oxidase
MRVVVIGAGFAGLIAADRIARSGQQVVVHEARDRVGGRVWSQRLSPDDQRTVIERGAEFVLDGYDVMRAVLTELGLHLADTTMSYYDREPRGGESCSAATVSVAAGDDALLARPAGRVHFAGEHTAGDWAGLMEGALRSGIRAAGEVLAFTR